MGCKLHITDNTNVSRCGDWWSCLYVVAVFWLWYWLCRFFFTLPFLRLERGDDLTSGVGSQGGMVRIGMGIVAATSGDHSQHWGKRKKEKKEGSRIQTQSRYRIDSLHFKKVLCNHPFNQILSHCGTDLINNKGLDIIHQIVPCFPLMNNLLHFPCGSSAGSRWW